MRQILLFLSPLLVSGLVSAQGAPLPDRDAQRREQIRDVLKSGRTGNTPGPMPSNSPVLLAQPPRVSFADLLAVGDELAVESEGVAQQGHEVGGAGVVVVPDAGWPDAGGSAFPSVITSVNV